MIKGTTPTHYFTLPFDVSLVANARIVYSQNEKVILRKNLSDCVCEGKTISCQLSQKETFLFVSKRSVQIQLRVRTTNNEVLNSNIETVPCEMCLDNEVLQ